MRLIKNTRSSTSPLVDDQQNWTIIGYPVQVISCDGEMKDEGQRTKNLIYMTALCHKTNFLSIIWHSARVMGKSFLVEGNAKLQSRYLYISKLGQERYARIGSSLLDSGTTRTGIVTAEIKLKSYCSGTARKGNLKAQRMPMSVRREITLRLNYYSNTNTNTVDFQPLCF